MLYPVFLSLKDCRVLVAGGGKVGRRKIAGLLAAGPAAVLVFDPGLSGPDKQELELSPVVRVFLRKAGKGDIGECALVFAATCDAMENSRIAALCRDAGVFCNVADDPDGSTFHVPAHARVRDLSAAFSTGGHSPALAGRIRKDAELWLEERYGPLSTFMGRLRPLVLALDGDAASHGELFRVLINSRLGEALTSGDGKCVRDIVTALLPAPLHSHIEELLHGL